MGYIREDYYSILQVHDKADNDVITCAYRLLSKKYHPDINKSKNAEELMKRINIAYSILSDNRKRTLYDIERSRNAREIDIGARQGAPRVWRHNDPADAKMDASANAEIEKAGVLIKNYYQHIKNGDFDAAYECVSAYDRAKIKRADFRKWRETVAKTYELREYEIEFYKAHRLMFVPKKVFEAAYEFTIRICERDIAKNSFAEYKTSKTAVRDKNGLGVYLGYSDVKPFIESFGRRGDDAADEKSMHEHWYRDRANHDPLTGMLNLGGFLSAAKTEVSRHTRHNSTFSIAVFGLRQKPATGIGLRFGGAGAQTPGDDAISLTGQFLAESIRDIDIPCRWKDGKFIVLFAEAGATAAARAAGRICAEYNKLFLGKDNPTRRCALNAGVSEYDSRSITSTIKKSSANLAFAKLGGRLAVKSAIARLRTIKPSVRQTRSK